MPLRSFRASMMRSSGASSSWVLNTSRTASRTAIMPRMRAAAEAERLAGSKLLPLRMTIAPSRIGVSAVLDAGERLGVEQRQAAGRALRPSGRKRLPAARSTARCSSSGVSSPSSVGSAPRYIVPSSFILPEHHLGMAGEIFVDRDRPVRAVDGLKLAPGLARAAARRARACAGTEYRS